MKASFVLVLLVLLACLFILADAAPANKTITGKRPREPKPKPKPNHKFPKEPKPISAKHKKHPGVSLNVTLKGDSKTKTTGLPKGPFHSKATECGAFFGLKYACNVPVTSNMMAAAISQHQWVDVGAYGASIVCGKKVCVTANGKTIKITILDQYLNGASGMLDMAPEAWNKLASAADIHRGDMPIVWNWC